MRTSKTTEGKDSEGWQRKRGAHYKKTFCLEWNIAPPKFECPICSAQSSPRSVPVNEPGMKPPQEPCECVSVNKHEVRD
jgi:hypothetical protein